MAYNFNDQFGMNYYLLHLGTSNTSQDFSALNQNWDLKWTVQSNLANNTLTFFTPSFSCSYIYKPLF